MPHPRHQIRALSASISSVEDTPPAVVLLEELLTGTDPACRDVVRPLFGPPVVAFDAAAPEVIQQVDAARMRAVQEVQEVNSRELGTLAERYAAGFQRLEQSVASIERVVASEVVDLALVVASELIQSEMRQSPELVLGVVEAALAQVPHDAKVMIRMHPDDLGNVRARMDADQGSLLDWREDPALSHGDCVVETPTRIIDASIESRIQSVRDSLVRTLMAEEKRMSSEGGQE